MIAPTLLSLGSLILAYSPPQADRLESRALATLPESPVHTDHIDHSGHDHTGNLPPIGVMGSHIHTKGDWMIGLRAMRMDMGDNYDGSDDVTNQDVLNDFMVTPTDMTMDMVMLGGMYGLTDDWTVGLMLPYVSNEMDHLTRMGGEFTTEADGIGDLRIGGAYRLADDDHHQWLLGIGVSAPTGDIDNQDVTPMGRMRLPYPMQVGSGTWDLVPSVTYNHLSPVWTLGTQLMYVLRTGENDNDYTLGDRIGLNSWISRTCGDWVPSLRLELSDWDDIDGADTALNPAVVPTADPDLRGGTRLDAFVGLDWAPEEGAFAGQRIGVELGLPAWQDLDGPQPGVDWVAIIGWTCQP